MFKGLNVSDFYFLESDYRSSLFKALERFDNIKYYNLANKGSLDWFADESHYSIKGHQKISKLIFPIFINLLEE